MQSNPLSTFSKFTQKTVIIVAIIWSLFQLWYASPLPFTLNFGILNDTEARSIHLAFAIFLAFLISAKKQNNASLGINWILALIGAFCAAYLFIFYESLSERPGLPTQTDIIAAVAGIILLLEATRRMLGLPLVIVVSIFLIYTFAGPYMPEVISHQGASLNKAVSHQWLGTEGVFGVALGVSTGFVFLFVLFGSILEKAGAGNYFLKSSFALLGHLKGGPAKAAVVSSGLSGIISGSSIANVVTTGTFTIPLMKKTGFSASKAGAIEVAASTNGQLTPPVMGAAAFLMVEYVGISYMEVVKHAIVPALISYLALFYIVHLEAEKAGMQGLVRASTSSFTSKLLYFIATLLSLIFLSLFVYYGLGWIKTVFNDLAIVIIIFLVLVTYIGLLAFSSRYEIFAPLDVEDLTELPDVRPTLSSGLHFLLPIVILLWCLTVEKLSPGLSAFWATLFMIFIILSQHPLITLISNHGSTITALKQGLTDLKEGLFSGAKNMIGIGVATATAGIVVGTVTLTGIGLVMTEFVELISGGNLLLILIFTAIICLLLGMGLPTTANYIVVSTLMAPVIVSLGAENGLIIPLIAVHLFVFYFGILADDTPPVGLAAYAAAGIAKSDPIKTGIQGFTYDIRTAILPFMFIFNTELILIGVDSWFHVILIIISSSIAVLAFAAATQGYWLTKSKLWESLILVLIAFTLFRPGFWWDMIYPPIQSLPSNQIHSVIKELKSGEQLKFEAVGETLEGKIVHKKVSLQLDGTGKPEQRLTEAGLILKKQDEAIVIDTIIFGSKAENAGLNSEWQISEVYTPSARPSKHWVYIPAIFCLFLLAIIQNKRKEKQK